MNHKPKITLLFFISLSISIFLFFLAFFYSKTIVSSSYKNQIESNFFEIKKAFSSLKSEKTPILNTIVENDVIKEFLETKKTQKIEKLFIDFIKANKNIFQIRIIDLNGKEVVRVNKTKKSIEVTKKENLQDKSDKYYLKEFLNLEKNQIGFSYIDLNVENKKIEKPYKATLRTAMPIYENDKKRYIVTINYNLNSFLESIVKGPNFNKYLLDYEGYFIINKNKDLNWSRHLENKSKVDEFFDINILDNKLINNSTNIVLKETELLAHKYYILYEPKEDLNIIKFIDKSKQIGILLFFAATFLVSPFIFLLYKYLIKLRDLNRTLVDSTNKMETILNNTSDGIVVIDKNGIIHEVNNAVINMFGYKRVELLNKNVNILIPSPHHEKHDEYIKYYDKQFNSKIINKDRELYGLHKDGSIINLNLTVTKVEIKKELYFIGNIKDLTQETKNKKLFEIVFAISPIGKALVLEDGTFWKLSDKFCSIVGYEREELINLNFKDITHKDDLEKDLVLLKKLLNKEISEYSLEKRYIKKDKQIVWVKLTVVGIYADEQKNRFEYFISTIDDITEEKYIKNKLLQTQEQLIEAEKIAQIGHWNYDLETQELKWSKNLLTIFGNKSNFTYDDFINCIIKEERLKVVKAIDEALIQYKKFDIIYKISIANEIKTIHSKGKIRFDNCVPKSFLGTCQDISEIKKLEEDKKEKEYLLMEQSKVAAMGEMTSAIAHQWRQPLNSIGFIIQDLISAYKHNEFNEEYLYEVKKEIMEQLRYMSDTIDEFRKFFKKDEPKTQFNIINTIFKINKLYMAQLNTHRIKLTVKVDGNVIKNLSNVVDFDDYIIKNQEGQLKQVILNCVSNAKDAILKLEKPSIYENQISIELDKEEDFIYIAIKDLAGGISKNDLKRIFEPYFTTKNMGTGLGLYICKSICEKSLNADIKYFENKLYVEEKEYKGSSFVIKLFNKN